MDKIERLNALFGADVVVRDSTVDVKREAALTSQAMDQLAEIEGIAARFGSTPDAKVTVVAFD